MVNQHKPLSVIGSGNFPYTNETLPHIRRQIFLALKFAEFRSKQSQYDMVLLYFISFCVATGTDWPWVGLFGAMLMAFLVKCYRFSKTVFWVPQFEHPIIRVFLGVLRKNNNFLDKYDHKNIWPCRIYILLFCGFYLYPMAVVLSQLSIVSSFLNWLFGFFPF